MLSEGQMRLAGFRTQTPNQLNGCFGQFKPRVAMVEAEKINSVVRSGHLTIGVKERRVVRHSLVKQLHGLEQILLCPRAKRNAIDQLFASQVEIVRNEVRRWRLLDSDFLGGRDFGIKLICDFRSEEHTLNSSHIT